MPSTHPTSRRAFLSLALGSLALSRTARAQAPATSRSLYLYVNPPPKQVNLCSTCTAKITIKTGDKTIYDREVRGDRRVIWGFGEAGPGWAGSIKVTLTVYMLVSSARQVSKTFDIAIPQDTGFNLPGPFEYPFAIMQPDTSIAVWKDTLVVKVHPTLSGNKAHVECTFA